MRLITTTQRVETNYKTHYIHVSRDGRGQIREINISSPGKFDNSSLNEFIIQLQDAINAVIGDAVQD